MYVAKLNTKMMYFYNTLKQNYCYWRRKASTGLDELWS